MAKARGEALENSVSWNSAHEKALSERCWYRVAVIRHGNCSGST